MNLLSHDWSIATSYFKMILSFEMCHITTVSDLTAPNWDTLTYLKGFPSNHNFAQILQNVVLHRILSSVFPSALMKSGLVFNIICSKKSYYPAYLQRHHLIGNGCNTSSFPKY